MIPLSRPHPQARHVAPEVVQTSVMDCGPASLQALLEGFGVAVSYGRLREACQTGIDGTSISTMDDIANLLGLDTEETMVPADHLLLAETAALPAIVVVRNPDGGNHFVVVWSIAGPWIQVMDPAVGRQLIGRQALRERLYEHTASVSASAWRGWAGSPEFLGALDVRLARLGIARGDRERLRAGALADPGWSALAALDTATRMTAMLVRSGALDRGAACAALIERQIERVDGDYPLLLAEYRSAWRAPVQADVDDETLCVRGCVLVRARGRRPDHARLGATRPSDARAALPPDLAAALTEPEVRPGRMLLGMLRADGLLAPAALGAAIVASATLVTISAVLLRSLIGISEQLGLPAQRAGAIGGVIGVLALGLLVDLPLIAGALWLGRALDVRLRLAFLRKLPRLDDRYFRSRLLSDMAERGHSLHVIRSLPQLGVRVLGATAQLVFTVAGIAWLHPASAPLALITVALCVGLPVVCQPVMAERELRVRSHAGALGRFYLDALLGLLPIRVHGARPAMMRQQEALLVQWTRAGLSFHAASTAVEGVLALCGIATAALMVWRVAREPASGVLLLVYWALSLPALGQELAIVARQYPVLRNVVARLLEPLGTPEPSEPAAAARRPADRRRGVEIEMAGVSVEAAGRRVLSDVDLAIAPGEHVAIIGRSGAGKSSLVGLLLGWYRPCHGSLEVDGAPLAGPALNALRRDTAWVEPAVTLWNRAFLDNLRYGATDDEPPLTEILSKARLREVLERLPDGLATELGEGGSMVSGGEGQRTRVGRALARRAARLVILDEPFRGLDRDTRRELTAMVRAWWADATLLWVTHDITETAGFGRVLVIEDGRVVEDGNPAVLARADSRYAALLRHDRALHDSAWSQTQWRRIWLADGALREEEPEP